MSSSKSKTSKIFATNDYHKLASQTMQEVFTSNGERTIVYYNDRFYFHNGRHYEQYSRTKLEDDIRSHLRRYTTVVKNGATTSFAVNSGMVKETINALRPLARIDETLDPPFWISSVRKDEERRSADGFVSMANGILCLKTRRLEKHTPKFFTTWSLDYDYDEKAEAPTEWLAFLRSIWPNDQKSIDTLQEFIGYIVSGGNELQAILYLVGASGGGKGTITRAIKSLIGEYNCASPSAMSLTSNFGLSGLLGKPLATIEDIVDTRGKDFTKLSELLLRISGGDAVTIDVKYQAPMPNVKLPTRFILVSNSMLSFPPSAVALDRRLLVLRFTKSFADNPIVALDDIIRSERTAILNWALNGYDRLQSRGKFDPPSTGKSFKQAMKYANNPLAEFVDERCEVGLDDYTVSCREFCDAYNEWREENGFNDGKEISSNTVGRNLHLVVPGVETTQKRVSGDVLRFYTGIRFRDAL